MSDFASTKWEELGQAGGWCAASLQPGRRSPKWRRKRRRREGTPVPLKLNMSSTPPKKRRRKTGALAPRTSKTSTMLAKRPARTTVVEGHQADEDAEEAGEGRFCPDGQAFGLCLAASRRWLQKPQLHQLYQLSSFLLETTQIVSVLLLNSSALVF